MKELNPVNLLCAFDAMQCGLKYGKYNRLS